LRDRWMCPQAKGSVEGSYRAMDQVILDPDNNAERDYVCRSRPDARHP